VKNIALVVMLELGQKVPDNLTRGINRKIFLASLTR